MAKPILVMHFPNIWHEREILLALSRIGLEGEACVWQTFPLEKLNNYAGFIILGQIDNDFYAHLHMMMALHPFMQALKIANAQGKPILGIGRGAQALVEFGFVPGLEDYAVGMGVVPAQDFLGHLTDKITISTMYLRLAENYQLNAFSKSLDINATLPISADSAGRLVIPLGLLSELENNGQCVFHYWDTAGQTLSGLNLKNAAVSNKTGNVMAILPYLDPPDALLHSMRVYLEQQYIPYAEPLHYAPRIPSLKSYHLPRHAFEFWTQIEGHEKLKALASVVPVEDLPPMQKFYRHWEIICDSPLVFADIIASSRLFCTHEKPILTRPMPSGLLIRPKEDVYGQQKQQLLQQHEEIKGLASLRCGILWPLSRGSTSPSHLFNPHTFECYYY